MLSRREKDKIVNLCYVLCRNAIGQANLVDFLPNKKHVKTAVAYSVVNRTISKTYFPIIIKTYYIEKFNNSIIIDTVMVIIYIININLKDIYKQIVWRKNNVI